MAGKGYKSEKWAGGEHWQCDSCPYDSTNEADMKKHVRSKHGDQAVAGEKSTG